MSNRISIMFPVEFPICTCKHCGWEFVIMSVTRGVDDEGEVYQNTYMLQSVWHCPHCGKQWNVEQKAESK